MKHELPKLEYNYDALEPFIDARTMEIHHSKHHQAYVDNLNKALENNQELQDKSAEDLIKDLNQIPENIRTAIRNNGGGHVNHTFFWQLLKKDTELKGELLEAINQKFGSFENFKEEFIKAAMTRFGSGWAWLVLNNNELEITSTQNQDSPLTEGKTPLLTVDVWEHAYYLKYQNKRKDYLEAFFSIINWDQVSEDYKKAKSL